MLFSNLFRVILAFLGRAKLLGGVKMKKISDFGLDVIRSAAMIVMAIVVGKMASYCPGALATKIVLIVIYYALFFFIRFLNQEAIIRTVIEKIEKAKAEFGNRIAYISRDFRTWVILGNSKGTAYVVGKGPFGDLERGLFLVDYDRLSLIRDVILDDDITDFSLEEIRKTFHGIERAFYHGEERRLPSFDWPPMQP